MLYLKNDLYVNIKVSVHVSFRAVWNLTW